MFSEILDLDIIEADKIFDELYTYFSRDFLEEDTYLNSSIYINPRRFRKDQGKELDFWHLTTKENIYYKKDENNRQKKVIERLLDPRRAERIEWIKKIIENHTISDIKLFYHQESNAKRDIRLYLWLEEHDFVVILQKLGKSSSFLVTSFYVTHDGKREEYKNRYEIYTNKSDENLKDCEWF